MVFEEIVKKAIIWSPLLQVLVLCTGVFASFLVAFYDGDVSVYMPYISETGAKIPEMGIFSATLTYGAIIGGVVVIYRYAILNRILSVDQPKLITFNKIGVVVGLISMVGCCLIAAFPMSTVFAVHVVGAIMHFGFGITYMIAHSYLSFKIFAPYYSRGLSIFRLVISLSMLSITIALGVTAFIGFRRWGELHPEKKSAMKNPDDQLYDLVLASAIMEWLSYTHFLTFFYTFLREFSMFEPEMTVQPTYDFGDSQFKERDSPILS